MSSRSTVFSTTCCGGRDGSSRKARDQIVGGIAEFADMQVVEGRVVFRAGADRRAADRGGNVVLMGAAGDVDHLPLLDVHAADEHGLGPGEILGRRRLDVFVDEPHLPVGRQVGRDQQ